MGHWAEECGDGVHDPRTFEWGEWLLWAPDPPMDRPMGRRGGREGRGVVVGQGEGVVQEVEVVGVEEMEGEVVLL